MAARWLRSARNSRAACSSTASAEMPRPETVPTVSGNSPKKIIMATVLPAVFAFSFKNWTDGSTRAI
jgi:hypothetical protein